MGNFTYHIRTSVAPLLLMGSTPLINIMVWMICRFYHGSVLYFIQDLTWESLRQRMPYVTPTSVTIVLTFALVEAVLMIVVPGELYKGPITPAGNRPTYVLNGIACYLLTTALVIGGFCTHHLPLGLVYDHLGEILLFVTVFAFFLCVFLYYKGLYFPSSTDSGSSGNVVWDFYWGTELHPQIFNFNLKQYCNCRLGMMGWHVLLLCFAAKQYELYGVVSNSMIASVVLQEVYIVKFFLWEGGYFGSLDIMHDRFGYYICWGVLCWIAGVYTLVGQYLVTHPRQLTDTEYWANLLVGVFFVWANYDADAQRARVRQTNGKCIVWGKPPKTLWAKYNTKDGKQHQSLLLYSGWWGVSRHAHYATEILLSLMWTIPAGTAHALPYFYVVYLTVLLVDRSYRDEIRCRDKYKAYWAKYCEKVKYSIIPFVY